MKKQRVEVIRKLCLAKPADTAQYCSVETFREVMRYGVFPIRHVSTRQPVQPKPLTGVEAPNPVPVIAEVKAGLADLLVEVDSRLGNNVVKQVKSNPQATDVRVYRLEKSGKQTLVFEGERTAELDDWCEADSNRTGCVLRMQDAVDTWVFKPAVFTPDPDGPPIGDAPKDVVKVYVINGNTETLLMELDKASGWRGRCDDHVRRTGEALKAIVSQE